MIKFIRADGEAIWVNPSAVRCVTDSHIKKTSGGCNETEIYYIGEGDAADIVAEAPAEVAEKLSHAMKYGTC